MGIRSHMAVSGEMLAATGHAGRVQACDQRPSELDDSLGRLIVPVGVAYGTDIELVRRLLLEIAASREEVINDGSAPEPAVFFLAFGPSSLDFELRCHLNHIDTRLAVKSAINFEIDRLFRQHGIAIPFPQQEVYIKEFPFPGGASASSPPAEPTPREGGDARG